MTDLRKNLIRVASELPKGSDGRKKILALLKEGAGMDWLLLEDLDFIRGAIAVPLKWGDPAARAGEGVMVSERDAKKHSNLWIDENGSSGPQAGKALKALISHGFVRLPPGVKP